MQNNKINILFIKYRKIGRKEKYILFLGSAYVGRERGKRKTGVGSRQMFETRGDRHV